MTSRDIKRKRAEDNVVCILSECDKNCLRANEWIIPDRLVELLQCEMDIRKPYLSHVLPAILCFMQEGCKARSTWF